MERIRLERHESSAQGTFGRIVCSAFALFSGELPWADNIKNISCIPAGLYECRWTYSPRFKRLMYSVDKVTKRTGVRIHSANFVGSLSDGFNSQVNGCIALGEKLGTIDKQKAVLLSAPAVRRFESFLGRKPFQLEIINGHS